MDTQTSASPLVQTNGNGHHANGNGHAANGHYTLPHEPAHYALLKEKIVQLKRERNAVILAHNYQEGAIQDVADFTGDSLNLARWAKDNSQADVIVFCGVHFMAETAVMLNPSKTVLMPDLEAGCALAEMVGVAQIRQWRRAHPEGLVVCYINTSAAVKAECDWCCTSSNAVTVVESLPAEKEILFVPDYYLGSYVKAKTKRNIHLWKGYCPAHAVISPQRIETLQDRHPDAEFLMHPECGCLTKQMDLADQILSTEGMVRYVRQSSAQRFIIATENGILSRLQKDNPDKTFFAASEHASCHYMQRNTLDKVFWSLVNLQHKITVDPAIAKRALVPIERMLSLK